MAKSKNEQFWEKWEAAESFLSKLKKEGRSLPVLRQQIALALQILEAGPTESLVDACKRVASRPAGSLYSLHSALRGERRRLDESDRRASATHEALRAEELHSERLHVVLRALQAETKSLKRKLLAATRAKGRKRA